MQAADREDPPRDAATVIESVVAAFLKSVAGRRRTWRAAAALERRAVLSRSASVGPLCKFVRVCVLARGSVSGGRPRRPAGRVDRTLLRPVAVPGAVDPAVARLVARHLLGRAEGCRSDSDGAFVHGGRSGAR